VLLNSKETKRVKMKRKLSYIGILIKEKLEVGTVKIEVSSSI